MKIKRGVVAHLFHGQQVFLVLRDDIEGIADPDSWDSVTETVEEGEGLKASMRRGLVEEIGVVPAFLIMLGVTRAGHGFFFGTFTDAEKDVIVLGNEGQKFGFFTLEEAKRLGLGGAIKHHLDTYPNAFKKMSEGITPLPEELRLQVLAQTR